MAISFIFSVFLLACHLLPSPVMTDLEENQGSNVERKFEKSFGSASLSAGVRRKYATSTPPTVDLRCHGLKLIQ